MRIACSTVGIGKSAAPGSRELRLLKDENEALNFGLVRKEKALAQAAALLVLQTKFRTLLGDEDK